MLQTNTISGYENSASERLLARRGFWLRETLVHSSNGFWLTLKPIVWAIRLAALIFSGEVLLGNKRIFAIEAAS